MLASLGPFGHCLPHPTRMLVVAMNGDHRYQHNPVSNAVAGPSKPSPAPSTPPTIPTFGGTANASADLGPSSSPPHHPVTLAPLNLFLPPPVPPPPKQHLESTQDLLARFHLHSAYDRYVRPAIVPGNEATGGGMGAGASSGDKGKGKEVDMDVGETGAKMGSDVVPGGGEDDDEGGGGKGEKKKKNTYKHLIKGLPEDAFAVSPEGLKGWNANALVLESAQAREDRRKRKELKRLANLAKAQQQQQQGQQQEQTAQPPAPGVPLQAPVPTTAPVTSFKSQGSGTPLGNPSTPRSAVVSGGTPRPGSTVPRPGSTISRPGTASGTPAATPVQPVQSAAKPPVPRPGSTVPRPGSTIQGLPPRPPSTHPAPPVTSMKVSTPYGDQPRGQKRPRDEANPGQMTNGSNGNGALNGTSNGTAPVSGGVVPPKPFLSAKAGSAGVRPRPVKKQRVDTPQSNGAVQQQPTPQGV
ncbi:hypothetical protein EST38_g8566 [Candolleomyces aberdarensis]|uniref:Uncharacterized protein n=1 Tax=Candolleomyces aberdarensis TaxID=2316362 RepID=A0A4Q2DC53_9AGAR|nr:hypothetical protein EST38_g8566 [Candolleomyces aberdarensis]